MVHSVHYGSLVENTDGSKERERDSEFVVPAAAGCYFMQCIDMFVLPVVKN